MTFSSLDDLITYMYAFYDSLKLDTGLQFDFLPINLKRCEEKLSCKDEMASHLEAYFKDQNVRQAKKTQSNACAQHKYASKIESLSKKRKPRYRTEYYKISKQLSRMDPTFKAKELMNQKESKQSARKNPTFKAKEIMYQKESKQTARKHTAFKRKEIESKQSERRDPTFKAKEIMYQKESKQTARKNPAFKRKEIKSKQSERRDPAFKAKEIMYQKESKQSERRNPIFKAKEIKYQKESKQSERRNPIFKAEEIKYQKESKKSARKEPVYKTKERESKQLARRNPSFRTKETVYQKESKRKARENPYFLECERIKKQQIRQEKRKFNDDSGIDVPRKRCKHNTDTLPKSHQKDLTIDESIKRFHSDIAIGPLYVCSCCHQTWFRKSVSMLKNTHISAESKRLHCTDFTSVGNEEWICHTCLSALRESKPPKLSVANGMKWPDKPPELNLHQLEERLIALRIPFMQIRELPRGGQYSLKGNVINVPVDIQPTINCLPRPMDENFTVAIQLKKKLSYKKS